MGAIRKQAKISGRTLGEAFKKLQDSDEREIGEDIYSGGWNNCAGIREISASEFDKRLKEENISKFEGAIAKCLKKPVSNDSKIKTSVENFPNKGARKWETRYIAEESKWGREVINEVSQTLAIKKARKYVETHPEERLNIIITKQLSTSAKVATISYKKSSKEADGVWEVYGEMNY